MQKECDGCGRSTERRNLGKIRRKHLCKKCRVSVRKSHRKKTFEESSEDEKQKIRALSRRAKRGYQKASRAKKRAEKIDVAPPKIKGSKVNKRLAKSNSYLTFEDKRQLISILLKKGLDFEQAKERVKEINEEQKRIRETMQEERKSEQEIEERQKQLIEELWES